MRTSLIVGAVVIGGVALVAIVFLLANPERANGLVKVLEALGALKRRDPPTTVLVSNTPPATGAPNVPVRAPMAEAPAKAALPPMNAVQEAVTRTTASEATGKTAVPPIVDTMKAVKEAAVRTTMV